MNLTLLKEMTVMESWSSRFSPLNDSCLFTYSHTKNWVWNTDQLLYFFISLRLCSWHHKHYFTLSLLRSLLLLFPKFLMWLASLPSLSVSLSVLAVTVLCCWHFPCHHFFALYVNRCHHCMVIISSSIWTIYAFCFCVEVDHVLFLFFVKTVKAFSVSLCGAYSSTS